VIALRRWLPVSAGCVLAWVMLIGPCRANSTPRSHGVITAVGAFAGEPSGISLKLFGSDGAFVINVGWSTRRDEGPDLSLTGMYDVHVSPGDRVYTTWTLGAGPRVTVFDNTEYSLVLPAGVSFIFPGTTGRHEIHVDAGPSFALSPHSTTSLYAAVGYRFLL
jgi:hypothetical protein